MLNFGTVIIAQVQYTDTFEIKKRPALVLFSELGNIICAAITSNTQIYGIELKKEEGAVKDSIIKLNYIFTISEKMVDKVLFSISQEKKQIIRNELSKRFK